MRLHRVEIGGTAGLIRWPKFLPRGEAASMILFTWAAPRRIRLEIQNQKRRTITPPRGP